MEQNGDRFVLVIDIRIEKQDQHGRYSGEQLSVRDQQSLSVSSFMQIAGVMARFHELADALRQEAGDAQEQRRASALGEAAG